VITGTSTDNPTPTWIASVAAQRGWRRGRVLAVLALGVLLGHLALLQGSGIRADAGQALPAAAKQPVKVVQLVTVRPVAWPSPAATNPAPAVPTPPRAALSGPLARLPQSPQLLQSPHSPQLPPPSSQPRVLSSSARQPLADSASESAAADPAAPSSSPSSPGLEVTVEGQPVPVYATAPPTAATLHYRLQRVVQGGVRTGAARIDWAPTPEGYMLSLAAEGGLLAGLGAASRGHFDAAGLAPERFVDRRRGRDVQATNFQRASGRVGHSGTPVSAELQPGTQDALSWLLQLPAVLQANAALAQPGAQVLMWVAAGRRAPQVWAFAVTGPASVALADGAAVPSLHLQRRAELPYDLQIDVWLDPARHHLPLRVRLAIPPGPWFSELLLTGPDGATP